VEHHRSVKSPQKHNVSGGVISTPCNEWTRKGGQLIGSVPFLCVLCIKSDDKTVSLSRLLHQSGGHPSPQRLLREGAVVEDVMEELKEALMEELACPRPNKTDLPGLQGQGCSYLSQRGKLHLQKPNHV
jgi:hypothetical protein